jgi:AraC-like DNA-binding protein
MVAPMLIGRSLFTRMCRARDRLAAHEGSPTVGRLARELGMSPFRFIRVFEALFGTTPHQARIAGRIDRAQQLLASSETSVTCVCMEVGFSSLGSFSSSFSRRVGRSPSAYRRHARGLGPEALTPGCITLLTQLPAGTLRNFEEAPDPRGDHAADLTPRGSDENQTQQHHGGRSDEGAALLHGGPRLP